MGQPILKREGDTLELDLSPANGYDFKDALNKAREIEGRRFDYARKLWCYEARPDVAERIMLTIRPDVSEDIRAWIRESKAKAAEELTSPLPDDAELLIPWATERMPWQPAVVNDEAYEGLIDYQRAAVDHLARHQRVILADDMGLGKTLEGISGVEEWRLRNARADGLTLPEGPRLVVAPNSVKGSWVRELERWLEDPPVQLVDGTTPKSRHNQIAQGIRDEAWTIINWEQLRVKTHEVKVQHRSGNVGKRKIKLMKEPLLQFPGAVEWDLPLDEWSWREHAKAGREKLTAGWLAALADEVHRAKNKDALQTQGLHHVDATLMFALTGTPLMNSPDELWAILKWLFPMEYTSYWDFYMKYVDFYENPYQGKVITGVKNPDALRFELKDRLVRRTTKVLKQKGRKFKGRKRIYFPVPLNPKQQKLYNDAEKEMWLQVEKEVEAGKAEAIRFAEEASAGSTVANLIRIPNGAARMVRLLQIIENSALVGGDDDSALMDDFQEKLEDSPNDAQWVVGVKYRDSCDLLANRLRKQGVSVGVYTGDVKPEDRTALEDRFQKGEVRVIVGTIDAMKEGITLTSAHLMYMMSRFFVPDLNEQWESRCDRLGQQELVLVYIPQAENSVAVDKVDPINRVKEKIVRAVVQKHAIEEAHE